MVLKLASDEVQEVHRALSAAHLQVVRELSRVDGYVDREAGLQLCQRKWKLEALLHQLDHSDDPHPVLELVPAGQPRSLAQRSRLGSTVEQTPSGLVTKESDSEDGTTETENSAVDGPQRYRAR
jgi:hypothetical protein